MKKIIYLWMILMAGCQGAAMAQSASQVVAAFYAKYPEAPSNFCDGCTLEVNPYFSTITDHKLGYSRVSYGNYTKEKEALVTQLNISRDSAGSWHPYPGDPSETSFYNTINKAYKLTVLKIAKGHYIGWILCAWSKEGAIISCTYVINEGLENQGQNAGTEQDIEAITRALVGSKSKDVLREHYKGPIFNRVDLWKGGWIDTTKKPVLFTDGKMTRVMTDVYWNLLLYGGQLHAYWFPNNVSAQHNYAKYEITAVELVKRLGFDPTKVIPATN